MLSKSDAQTLLEQFCRAGLTGAAAAIVANNETDIVFAGRAASVPVHKEIVPDIIYDLASLTKVVGTVTGILWCMERGLVRQEDRVSKILPWYRHQTTVLQLLTHTSGLTADDKAFRQAAGRGEQEDFIAGLELEYPAGSRVVYSDFGFILLGWIVEAVAGDLDELLRREIFCPLGMTDTGYLPARHGLAARCAPTEEVEGRGVVQGEVHDSKAFAMGGISGHAGLFSTTADLAKYAQMLLSGGGKVLKAETVALLRRCCTRGPNEGRGYGWLTCDGEVLYHTGFTGTSMSIDFGRQEAVILLTNAVHPKRGRVDLPALRQGFHGAYFQTLTNWTQKG